MTSILDVQLADSTAYIHLMRYAGCQYKDFIGFVKDFLAHQMELPFEEEDYYKEIWDNMWRYQKTHDMLPRGHSKTELIHIWATIYLAIFQPINPFYDKNGRTKDIIQQLISSSDWTSTGEIRDRILEYMEGDEALAQFLPNARDKAKNNHLKLELKNGSKILFRSIKMKRGAHVDRIAFDDLTTETSTLTDKETWDFLTGACLPMGTVKSAMVNGSGTPIRFTDVNMRIHAGDSGKQWRLMKKPAIVDWETKEILGKNRFTWKMLMDKREEIGSVKFESEYMLNPLDSETTLIQRKWIENCYDHSFDLTKHRAHYEDVFLGVDFAFSDRATADYSIFAIVGLCRGKYYLLDYIRKKGLSATEHLQIIQELHAIYKFDLIGLEENSIKAVVKDWKQLGLPLKLYRTANIDERDKRKPDFSDVISVKKEGLVLRLGTTFENQGLILPFKSEAAKDKIRLLRDECMSWQLEEGKLVEVGLHPDIPIAVAYALEVATKNSFAFGFA